MNDLRPKMQQVFSKSGDSKGIDIVKTRLTKPRINYLWYCHYWYGALASGDEGVLSGYQQYLLSRAH